MLSETEVRVHFLSGRTSCNEERGQSSGVGIMAAPRRQGGHPEAQARPFWIPTSRPRTPGRIYVLDSHFQTSRLEHGPEPESVVPASNCILTQQNDVPPLFPETIDKRRDCRNHGQEGRRHCRHDWIPLLTQSRSIEVAEASNNLARSTDCSIGRSLCLRSVGKASAKVGTAGSCGPCSRAHPSR